MTLNQNKTILTPIMLNFVLLLLESASLLRITPKVDR
jgi:hypothetical protein